MTPLQATTPKLLALSSQNFISLPPRKGKFFILHRLNRLKIVYMPLYLFLFLLLLDSRQPG